MTAFFAVFAGLLGALIGSFGNVVIYRLPRGESIAFPGSHCPHCNHTLGPLELIPVLSFIALRGRCRSCGTRIAWRYPIVESVMAALFVALVLRWPLDLHGASVVPLLAVLAMLVMAAVIDLDLHILPDALTLPALALALLGPLLYAPSAGLPTFSEAALGAAAGAGALALINRLGALVLRRGRDTKERLWPISLDHVNVAAVAGAIGGWLVGVVVGAVSVVLNLVSRRTLRLPEGALYALWAVVLALSAVPLLVSPAAALGGSVVAAGAWALVGAVYWWLHDLRQGAAEDVPQEGDDEPVAMGFGDVKLAAVLGAILGWPALLVALFLAVTLGAVAGVTARLAGGQRIIPFGPALLVGGVLALFFGHQIIAWYLGLLGLGA